MLTPDDLAQLRRPPKRIRMLETMDIDPPGVRLTVGEELPVILANSTRVLVECAGGEQVSFDRGMCEVVEWWPPAPPPMRTADEIRERIGELERELEQREWAWLERHEKAHQAMIAALKWVLGEGP
jgi:hypothetical protein